MIKTFILVLILAFVTLGIYWLVIWLGDRIFDWLDDR